MMAMRARSRPAARRPRASYACHDACACHCISGITCSMAAGRGRHDPPVMIMTLCGPGWTLRTATYAPAAAATRAARGRFVRTAYATRAASYATRARPGIRYTVPVDGGTLRIRLLSHMHSYVVGKEEDDDEHWQSGPGSLSTTTCRMMAPRRPEGCRLAGGGREGSWLGSGFSG
eukprot:SAG22_NODE_771_length_7318_cov_6.057487_4_plen_175_part_00